ncbi:hypothetical protein HT585_30430 [Ensifer sp. HO-A22]|uniref:Uncharacterized protein n=1 Tax=Ensifer oleiphilus TaxID=2742698 RepID=A0A7Y6URV0_9HYPH|nr:hypothetical protein [Ensifer oleiphilus]NVD43188.1 hypothetical protein [Ensifer oleiphilus]
MRDIADAVKVGERNRDTMMLVRNYCAHARVERFGGIGMLVQVTGLPIGHHGMRCDFAPEGGMSSWDLRDAVIDFYDRNCENCAHRKPIGLPNLLEIIAERDRERTRREAEVKADEQASATALAERDAVRAALLPRLGPVGRTLLEDIGAFDADRSSDNCERVTQSARLAPEYFSPELVEYVFALASAQRWFAEPALTILAAVGADDTLIVKLAISILQPGYPSQVAIEKLLARLNAIPAGSVANILSAAIDLASPDDRDFIYGDGERRLAGNAAFLEALWLQFPDEVIAVIEKMLLGGKRSALERAGRGLHVLQASDPNAAKPILRTLVSVYVRAPSLVSDLREGEDRLPDLAAALNSAFDAAPQEVDALLQSLQMGAPAPQRVRIAKAYAHAVDVGYNDPPIAATSLRHSLALRRLVWIPTVERDDRVLDEVTSAFRSGPKGLENIIRDQLDAFIGALFLLDDRLTELDAVMNEPAENTIAAMERNSRRMVVRGLMVQFVEWASEAAAGNEPAVAKIIGTFDTIPDGRDNLRGVLLGATKELSHDLNGLKQLLPHLYSALVGPSAIVRSYAATAVGELSYRSRENIPDLLFEAFGALLWDQYVVVHKSTVAAFHRSIIPEPYRINAAQAILNLIRYYRMQSSEDHFLTECVSILAGMADLFGQSNGTIRCYLIEVAMGIDPIFLRSGILSLSHSLGTDPEFAKLAARMIPHLVDRYNQSDRALDLIRRIAPQGVKAHAQTLHDTAVQVVDADLQTSLGIVEAFSLAGMSKEADDLVTALLDRNGNTVRVRRRRTLLQWPQFALRFEAAVTARDAEAISAASGAWRNAAATDAQDEEDEHERRARSSLPF